MNKSLLTVVLVSIGLLGTSAQANLITNGSFETLPNPLANGTWTTYTQIEGWTASVGEIEVRNNVEGVAQDGNVFVELDARFNSAMYSQTVATVSGQAYTLSYYYAPRNNIPATSNGIELYVNGSKVDEISRYSTANNAWELRTFSIFGTGNDVIGFKAAGTSDSYGGSIDNVSLTAASVPEPSIMLLLGFGLVGIFGMRRKIR